MIKEATCVPTEYLKYLSFYQQNRISLILHFILNNGIYVLTYMESFNILWHNPKNDIVKSILSYTFMLETDF